MQPSAFVDHRVYTIALRKTPQFLEMFNSMALPVLVRHLGNPIGFYVSYVGPLNQFIHQWGYDSLADYETRGRARDADPEFAAYLSASEKLIVAQENRLIKRVAMSNAPGI
jgi:hypothetical protein